MKIKRVIARSVSFGLFMSVVLGLFFGFREGITFGMFVGVANALNLEVFEYRSSKRFEMMKYEMSRTLNIIYDDSVASHSKRSRAVSGWLFLTDTELMFKLLRPDLADQEISIPLNKILKISTANNFGIIPNGIVIETTDKKSERFILYDRNIWLQRIQQAYEHAIEAPPKEEIGIEQHES